MSKVNELSTKVIVFLVIISFVTIPIQHVSAVEPTITTTIVILGVATITTYFTSTQLSTFISTLSSTAYSRLIPNPAPITDLRPREWRIELRPENIDWGREIRKRLQDVIDSVDNFRTMGDIIRQFLEDKRAGVGGVDSAFDCGDYLRRGYYLCRRVTTEANGFRETWLEWARHPRETTSRMLIGVRDIAPPLVQVISPNGGEVLTSGDTYRIRWAASDNSHVVRIDIYYSDNGGRRWQLVAERLDNIGYFDWRIPDTSSINVMVKIEAFDAAGNRRSDTSDRPFTIIRPSIRVTSPNGREVWDIGSVQTIRWTSTGITGNVRIDLSRDGGSTWTTIISSTPNDGSEQWTVTGPPTNRARIRIVSLANPAIWDVSDQDFTIRDTTPPSVRVTSPNGGEVWRVGETRKITWTATDNVGVTRIDIFYSTDGGRTWRTIATGLSNTGSYNWRIPNTPSTNCLVRIDAYDTSGNRGSDTSDKPFTIRP
jgi:hypothetical protein